MKNQILGALAPAFNRLLGISDSHFGHTPRKSEPGEGAKRAAARIREHGEQWDGLDLRPERTRQQLRAMARRIAKGERSALKRSAMSSKCLGGAATIH